MKILNPLGWLFYKCIMNAKMLFRIALFIYVLALLFGCKSSEKSQSTKSESVVVSNVDSS